MSNRKLLKLLTIFLAFALIAAACGDDDDDGAAGDDSSESVLGGEDDDGGDAEDDDAMADEDDAMDDEDDAMDDEDDAMDDEEDDGGDAAGGLADDATHGVGAEAFEAAINNPPGPADDSLEPVVITMANLEGDALGSFPEIREGLEIAVDQINNDLGGIDGRPVEVEICVHGFDPNAAINCGNEIAETQPNLNINGIEFFTPALWPTFLGANVPTIQTVPIFVSDFAVEGNGTSVWGGCPVAFPGGATYTMETLGLQKVAVVYSNTPPGLECYADTEERFWQYLVDNEAAGAEFIGVSDNSGDPSDNDAIVQQIADFFDGDPADTTGIFFGIQASDCNEILSAIDAAGLDTTIVASGSCIDDSVQANPAAVGAQFGQQGRISERPDLYDEYAAWELTWREDKLDNSPLRTAPVSAFLRVGHATGILAWEVLNRIAADGGDIDDAQTVIDAFLGLENQHIVGVPPVTCTDNTAEFPAVCKKTITYVEWDGSDWVLVPPLNGEYFNVGDIQNRVAAGNPRPEAEG